MIERKENKMEVLKMKLKQLKRVRKYLDHDGVSCSDSLLSCPRYLPFWDCHDCLALYDWKLNLEQVESLRRRKCPCRAEELGFLASGEAITLLDNAIDELSEALELFEGRTKGEKPPSLQREEPFMNFSRAHQIAWSAGLSQAFAQLYYEGVTPEQAFKILNLKEKRNEKGTEQ
jgi:hypothetical protein